MKKDESMDIYFYIIGWIGIALVAGFALVIHIFGTGLLDTYPGCVFNHVTGYYCPGCGGTRAAFAIARGQIIRSFKFHPIVLYTVVVGGWFMLSQTIEKLSKGKIAIAMHFRSIYIWLAVFIIFANFIYKNLLIIFFGIKLLG